MIYMVDCSFSDPAREAEWNEWYIGHLDVLLTVPGIHTAQRFQALTSSPPRYIAMYTADSPEVFTSEGYRGIGGGRFNATWQPYIRDWHRNLFDGADRAPEVPLGSVLVVADRETKDAGASDLSFTWLRSVDMDKSTPYRGLAIVDRRRGEELVRENHTGIKLYEPMTSPRHD